MAECAPPPAGATHSPYGSQQSPYPPPSVAAYPGYPAAANNSYMPQGNGGGVYGHGNSGDPGSIYPMAAPVEGQQVPYYQQLQQQYPPYGSGAATASATCNLTRRELDLHLATAGYGANAIAFSCYFTRDPQTGAPRCIACGRYIADHPSGEAVLAGAPTGGVVIAAGGLFEHTPTRPSGLETDADGSDVRKVTPPFAILIPCGILLIVATVMLIAFGASGLIRLSGGIVVVGPCIMIIVSLLLILFLSRTTIRVHRRPHVRWEDTEVEIFHQRLITCCCPSEHRVHIRDILAVDCNATNTRVNRQQIFEVVMRVRDVPDGTAVLYRGTYFEAEREAANWRAYFADGGLAA